MNIVIERATVDDAAAILAIQRLAYRREAELYQDDTIPPLTQTLSASIAEFDDHIVLRAVVDSVIVGSVRGHVRGDTCYIGRLCVTPRYQGHGIGSRLMVVIEQMCQPVTRFELFTGYKSVGNIHLYERLGYREFKRESFRAGLIFVFMEKGVESIASST